MQDMQASKRCRGIRFLEFRHRLLQLLVLSCFCLKKNLPEGVLPALRSSRIETASFGDRSS